MEGLPEQSQEKISKTGHHLRTADLILLSLRIFRTKPFRTFLTILGMSVGIGTVLVLISLGYGLQYILIGKLVATEDSLVSVEAFYPTESNLSLTDQDLAIIADLPEAAEISPLAEFTGELKLESGLSGYILARAVKPNYFRLSGTKPDFGAAFGEDENVIIISNTALKILGMSEDESSLGQKTYLKIAYQNEEGDAKIVEIPGSLNIKGIINDEYSPPFIYLPASLLPEKPASYPRAYIKAKTIDTVTDLRDRLVEKGLIISARIDLVNQARKIMTIITSVLGVFGVTALVVASIGMFNTMIIGFLERIFEVGIMKSLGATSVDIRNLFLMESLIIGFLGGMGGIVGGVAVGETINFGLNILAKQLGGQPLRLFIYPVQFLILIIILSTIVGIFSGFWPARQASRLSPKEAFVRK